MKFRSLSILIIFALAVCSSARASLVWEQQEIELHPTISDKTAVAHFKYKNTGDQPVKITNVQPSCGCTTAEPPKDPVAPGQSGEIVATFNIGERFGEQTKTIRVATDDPQNETTVLKLKANIPRLLELNPIFLWWKPGEERKPKTVEAKLGGDFPVTKLDVTSTDPTVKVESAAVPNEKAFRITVTPEAGNRPVTAMLAIKPDYPKDAPKTFRVSVRADGPRGAGAPARPPVAVVPQGRVGASPTPVMMTRPPGPVVPPPPP